MRFAICNETFQGLPWKEACHGAAAAGYEGIEIAPFTLAEDCRSLTGADRARIRRTAAEHGLDIVGLHWLLVSPRGLSATSDDDSVRRATALYLVALADLCGDLGGRIMVLGSPAQRRIPPGCTRERAEDRLLETVRPALDRAAARGVLLCLEPLPPPEADLLLTLDDARRLLERLDHPAARTIFDVKSASAEGAPLHSLIRAHASRIAHVHANDANRRGPGFGCTDFRPILGALRDIGYGGWVSVEVFDYTPDATTIAVESLRHLRACLPPSAEA